jgi:hypothetical protein
MPSSAPARGPLEEIHDMPGVRVPAELDLRRSLDLRDPCPSTMTAGEPADDLSAIDFDSLDRPKVVS